MLTLIATMKAMTWTHGNHSDSETLTDLDDLFPSHVNELRVASDTKASLVSPAFTEIPTAPTATLGTNTNQLATTAFVLANGGTGDVLLGGDLGHTTAAPWVTSTHLSSPLPVAQGGTNSTTAGAALTALGTGTATITGPTTFNAGTFLDKGNQVFDVTAFGAVGDGSTDSTSGILGAITAAVTAGGGGIYFPDGIYNITSAFNLNNKPNLRFFCSAPASATIQIPQASLSNFANLYMFYGQSTSADVVFENLRLYGRYSVYTAPPGSQGGGLSPGKRWTIKNCLIEDFNYFGLFVGVNTVDTKVIYNRFKGPGRGPDHLGGGGGTNVEIAHNVWESDIVGNAIDVVGGSYNVHDNWNYSIHNFYFEGVIKSKIKDNHHPNGGSIVVQSDSGYAPAIITNSNDVEVNHNSLTGGGAITFTITMDGVKTSTVGGVFHAIGNTIDSPLDYGILFHAGHGAGSDISSWGNGNVVADNTVINANANNDSSMNTGLAIINPSGINIAQGLDVVVSNNACVDTRVTPQQNYGIQIGQNSFVAANSEPNRVTLSANRISGTVSGDTNIASPTYTTDYVEYGKNILLTTGSITLPSGTLSIGTAAATKPLTVAANSSQDVWQIKNFAGTDKWHLAVTSGTAFDVIETGVASRLKLAAGGGVTLTGLLTTGSLSAGAGTLTSLTLDGSGSSASGPLLINGSGTFNDLAVLRTNAGTAKWTFGIKSGTDFDITETGVANNRFYIKVGGNVGIGTASPSTLLQVAGTVTATLFAGSGASLTTLSEASLSSAVAIARGGTGQTTASTGFNALSPLTTAGDILYGGASGAGTRLAPGTSVQLLHGGTTPSWSAISLTADVSGVLPIANGGTNSATQNWVDLTTAQASIAGAKTFTSPLTIDGSGTSSIPQTIKGSASFNDLVQYKNNSGTAKWTWGLTSGNDLDLTEAGVANHRIYVAAGGNIGFRNITAPGAALHLPAGSTAATSGPLKFTSGPLMTTAEIGVIEFLTDTFYGTITTGAARNTFAMLEKAQTWSAAQTINANLILGTAGNKLNITTGSNASVGTGTLVGGTVTISTTAVTANSLIFLQDTASSITNVGTLTVSAKVAGTSFTVTSTLVLDVSTFNWWIIN